MNTPQPLSSYEMVWQPVQKVSIYPRPQGNVTSFKWQLTPNARTELTQLYQNVLKDN